MKYKSITTPSIEHDAANMLVELMWLNGNLMLGEFPWRGSMGREWGKSVSAIKKLMKEPFCLTPDQLAFYMYRCIPRTIDSDEFAKMAVVAKKLLRRFDLAELRDIYEQRRGEVRVSGVETTKHKQPDGRSLMTLLRELEDGDWSN